MPIPSLSAVEARVLCVLAEKQRTVPDTYPLTLNALVSGCNQKTSRDPVMEVSDAQAQQALDRLRSMTLIIESSGGRVPRYAHNMERVLQVPSPSAAILTVLILRGPQTAGELRINCDRLHKFADISAVEGFLHELAERPGRRARGRAGAAARLAGKTAGHISFPDRRRRSSIRPYPNPHPGLTNTRSSPRSGPEWKRWKPACRS
jgi:uncharacterized protein YceH (UPF0502 family)